MSALRTLPSTRPCDKASKSTDILDVPRLDSHRLSGNTSESDEHTEDKISTSHAKEAGPPSPETAKNFTSKQQRADTQRMEAALSQPKAQARISNAAVSAAEEPQSMTARWLSQSQSQPESILRTFDLFPPPGQLQVIPARQAEDDDLRTVAHLQTRQFPGSTAPPSAFEKAPPWPLALSLSVPTDAQLVEQLRPAPVLDVPQIRAFAKLEFEDGPFYMNTYSVELGRDVRAARLALRRDFKGRDRHAIKLKQRSSSVGNIPTTPAHGKRDSSAKMTRSVVSESGGIMGVDTTDGDDVRKKRKGWRRSKKSRSTSSSSQLLSRMNSSTRTGSKNDGEPVSLLSLSHRTSGVHPVDPLSLLPSPDECPLIPIHPSATSAETGGHRGISRKHVRIAFNFEKHVFELHIKGKNGAFVDDRWHASGESIPLRSGTNIQIGGVGLRFVLPDVTTGDDAMEDVHEQNSKGESGSAISDDLIDVSVEDGELDHLGGKEGPESNGTQSGMEEQEEGDEESDGADANAADAEEGSDDDMGDEEPERTPTPPPIPKKRGPGRPPKNGISKKKMQEAAREAARKSLKGSDEPVKKKGKVGRPRKHPLPEVAPPKPEKRKYTKRKGTELEPVAASKESITEQTDKWDSATTKEKKGKRQRAPRSPSPVFDESKLTAEQLQKPQASYVVLLHEALSNCKTGTMSLPQIYRAIERRYPYFKLRVTTTGWQSSVRHNLSQHHAFQKVERDGKGWMWGLVPGVSIEKEKRRKASPSMPPVPQYPQQPPLSSSDSQVNPSIPSGISAVPNATSFASHGASSSLSTASGFQVSSPAQNFNGLSHKPPTPSYQSPYASNTASAVAHASAQNPTARPLYPPSLVNRTSQAAEAHVPGMNLSTRSSPAFNPQVPQPTVRAPRQSSQAGPPTLSQDVIKAVQNFKTALVKSMPQNKHAEAVVQSAINRVLGLSDKSSLPGGREDPQEATIMKALSTIIGSFSNAGARSSGANNMAGYDKAHSQSAAKALVASQAHASVSGQSHPQSGQPAASPSHRNGLDQPRNHRNRAAEDQPDPSRGSANHEVDLKGIDQAPSPAKGQSNGLSTGSISKVMPTGPNAESQVPMVTRAGRKRSRDDMCDHDHDGASTVQRPKKVASTVH